MACKLLREAKNILFLLCYSTLKNVHHWRIYCYSIVYAVSDVSISIIIPDHYSLNYCQLFSRKPYCLIFWLILIEEMTDVSMSLWKWLYSTLFSDDDIILVIQSGDSLFWLFIVDTIISYSPGIRFWWFRHSVDRDDSCILSYLPTIIVRFILFFVVTVFWWWFSHLKKKKLLIFVTGIPRYCWPYDILFPDPSTLPFYSTGLPNYSKKTDEKCWHVTNISDMVTMTILLIMSI